MSYKACLCFPSLYRSPSMGEEACKAVTALKGWSLVLTGPWGLCVSCEQNSNILQHVEDVHSCDGNAEKIGNTSCHFVGCSWVSGCTAGYASQTLALDLLRILSYNKYFCWDALANKHFEPSQQESVRWRRKRGSKNHYKLITCLKRTLVTRISSSCLCNADF